MSRLKNPILGKKANFLYKEKARAPLPEEIPDQEEIDKGSERRMARQMSKRFGRSNTILSKNNLAG